MKVYDYVVFFVPNKEQQEKGEKARIIIQDRIIEKDDSTAQMKVTRAIPAEWDDKLDQLTIVIRPF